MAKRCREVSSLALWGCPSDDQHFATAFRPALGIDLSPFIKPQHHNHASPLSFQIFVCKQARISYFGNLLFARGCNLKYTPLLLLGWGPLVRRMNHSIALPKTGWACFKLPAHTSARLKRYRATISMRDLLPKDTVETRSINGFKAGLDRSVQDNGPSEEDPYPLLPETRSRGWCCAASWPASQQLPVGDCWTWPKTRCCTASQLLQRAENGHKTMNQKVNTDRDDTDRDEGREAK